MLNSITSSDNKIFSPAILRDFAVHDNEYYITEAKKISANSIFKTGLVAYHEKDLEFALSCFRESNIKNENEELYDYWIARVLSELDKHEEAAVFYQQHLHKLENKNEINTEDLAISLNNLANTYNQLNLASKAIPLIQKAIAITESNVPLNEDALVTYYNNIGYSFKQIGNLEAAEVFFRKILIISEKNQNNYSLIFTLNNLANLMEQTGRLDDAEKYSLKVVNLSRAFHDLNPEIFAKALNNLAVIYLKQGNKIKSLETMLEALEIYTKIFPANHPYLLAAKNNLEQIESA